MVESRAQMSGHETQPKLEVATKLRPFVPFQIVLHGQTLPAVKKREVKRGRSKGRK